MSTGPQYGGPGPAECVCGPGPPFLTYAGRNLTLPTSIFFLTLNPSLPSIKYVGQHVYVVSTKCLWNVYAMSTRCLWNVYVMSTKCLWTVYIMSTTCLWKVWVMSMERVCHVY